MVSGAPRREGIFVGLCWRLRFPHYLQDTSSRVSSTTRERLIVEPPLAQEKAGAPALPSHLLSAPYPFGLSPSSVVPDARFPPLK